MSRRTDGGDRSPWEPWEIRALHKVASLAEAQAKLAHRPPEAVKIRARKEGAPWALVVDVVRMPDWTRAEDAKILALRAKGLRWSAIAAKIGRTEGACRVRGVILRRRATMSAQYPPATVTAAAR